MKKIFLILSLFITVFVYGQSPVSPVGPITTNTVYYEPSTGIFWTFHGSAYGYQTGLPPLTGSTGLYLKSTGTGVIWAAASSGTPTLQQVTTAGNTTTLGISAASFTSTATDGSGGIFIPKQMSAFTNPPVGYRSISVDQDAHLTILYNKLGVINGYKLINQEPTGTITVKLPFSATAVLADSNQSAALYVPQTRTLTINGTTLDLSANRSWTVSGTTPNALTLAASGGASAGATFNGSAAITADYHTLGAQQALTLTTIGTSGAATLSGPTLNIPQYSGNNIYNSNGTLTGIRNVSNGGFRLGISDSLYVSVPNAMHTYSGASIPFFGTSITVGFFANPITTLKYSTLVSGFLGVTENNLGTSGMHVQETGDGFAFQDHETSVPSYNSSTMPYGMVLELGPNDFNSYTGGGGTYQPTQYTTDLTSLLTYLTVTKGYPANKILILSNSYYGTFGYTATKTAAIYATYRSNSASVAATFGCPYLDIFTYFQNRGGNALLFSDQLHPNNRGHAVEANAVESILAPATTYRAAQNFATQFGEFATMKLNNTTTLPDSVNTILGRNAATGMLGSLSSLPSNISANNLFWRGVQIDTGFYYNYTPGHQDIIKSQSSNIIGQYLTNPAFYTKLQLVDGNVGFVFSTIGSNIPTSPMATFSSPSQSTAVKILQSGQIVANSIAFPNFGNSFSITATGGSATGTLTPFGTAINSDFATVISNGYSAANIVFNTSRGVNNTITEAGRFSIQGNFLSKTTIDDGFSPEAFIAARFQQGFNIGRISKVTTFANPTPLTTGGTIAAGPRFYKILATDAFGKTTEISSVEATCTTTGTTSSVPITWTAVTGASGYRVYEGSTSGGENQYISSVTNSVTDIGSGYTSATPPTQNTTSYGNVSPNAQIATPTIATFNHTIFTPSTGGTVALVSKQENIINPAGTIATLTITLPSTPANNDVVYITFTQAVTAITYSGGTVVGSPTTASLGGQWHLTYDGSSSTWY